MEIEVPEEVLAALPLHRGHHDHPENPEPSRESKEPERR
jgi:hypothetical protein